MQKQHTTCIHTIHAGIQITMGTPEKKEQAYIQAGTNIQTQAGRQAYQHTHGTHTYIHTRTNIHTSPINTHRDTHAVIQTCILPWIHPDTYIYPYMLTVTHRRTYKYIQRHTYIHTYIHTHIHTNRHAGRHTYTHTHAYIRTMHKFRQTCVRKHACIHTQTNKHT